ncbi:MAG: hypothetical protein ACE5E1_06365, partial [Phycisphaerae bacterium]
PEVDELPAPFPRVIRKALAKDPKDRYQTVTELVSELFEVEDLSRSVAAFEPASLSTLAARAAEKLNVAPAAGPGVGVLGTGSSNVGQAVPPPVIDPAVAHHDAPGRLGRIQERIGGRMDRRAERIDRGPMGRQVTEIAGHSQNWFEKILLALIVCAAMSVGATVLTATHDPAALALAVFVCSAAVVGGVILGHWICVKQWFLGVIDTAKRPETENEEKSKWLPGIVSAVLVAAVLLPLSALFERTGLMSSADNGWIIAILSAVVLFDWRSRLESGRRGRVSLGPAFSAGLYAFLVGLIFLDGDWVPLAAMLAAASLGVQAVAGVWPAHAEVAGTLPPDAATLTAGAGGWNADAGGVAGGVAISRDETAEGAAQAPPPIPQQAAVRAIDPALLRSNTVRAVWFLASIVLMLGMIFAFASIGILKVTDDQQLAAHVIVGIVLVHAFLFALSCAIPRCHKGIWRGIVRKAIFFGGAALAGSSGVAMGLVTAGGEEDMLALAGILLGGVAALFVWFIPVPPYAPTKPEQAPKDPAARSRARRARTLSAVGGGLLCLGLFLTPILLVTVPEHDWDEVLPAVLAPLGSVGFALLMGGIGLNQSLQRLKIGRSPKLELPIRRAFLVDSVDDLDSLLERHMMLFDYTLKKRGDLVWSFQRGDRWAQFWQPDIRRWPTRLNIAAYPRPGGDYRITCYLDVESGWNPARTPMLRRLETEMDELRDLMNGRPLPEPAEGENT